MLIVHHDMVQLYWEETMVPRSTTLRNPTNIIHKRMDLCGSYFGIKNLSCVGSQLKRWHHQLSSPFNPTPFRNGETPAGSREKRGLNKTRSVDGMGRTLPTILQVGLQDLDSRHHHGAGFLPSTLRRKMWRYVTDLLFLLAFSFTAGDFI